MKNIQLERRYLHNQKRQVVSNTLNIFSLLAPRKGIGALAPSMRECAQNFSKEREYV